MVVLETYTRIGLHVATPKQKQPTSYIMAERHRGRPRDKLFETRVDCSVRVDDEP